MTKSQAHKYGPADHVVIGYCHNGSVRQEFMHALINFFLFDTGTGSEGRWETIVDARGPYIAFSRNDIVNTFLTQSKAHWLWFLDVDMIFEPDTLERLMALADPVQRPVLSAMYVSQVAQEDYEGLPGNAPPVPWVPLWGQELDGLRHRQVRQVPPGELVPLTYCGMGCTLIHRSVLQAMAEIYPDDPHKWFGHDLVTIDPKVGPVRMGEDVTFCNRALDAGFSIWGVPGVQCGHVKSTTIGAADITSGLSLVAG